jgi:hypothetical protein
VISSLEDTTVKAGVNSWEDFCRYFYPLPTVV